MAIHETHQIDISDNGYLGVGKIKRKNTCRKTLNRIKKIRYKSDGDALLVSMTYQKIWLLFVYMPIAGQVEDVRRSIKFFWCPHFIFK